jgi:PilZ domain
MGKRRQKRVKMVLPVRIFSKGPSSKPFNELAHTLDITPTGARLGSVRHPLKTGETLTLQYRQRRLQFRVVWVKPLDGTAEFQVGLESVGGGDGWGLELSESQGVDEYTDKS